LLNTEITKITRPYPLPHPRSGYLFTSTLLFAPKATENSLKPFICGLTVPMGFQDLLILQITGYMAVDIGGAASGAGKGAAAGAAFGPWGAVIGGAIGLGASLLGGNKAAKQRKLMENYLNGQDTENKAWYNANALSDYTQRADTQNLMKQLRDNLSRQNRIAANTAVVTGATPEQQAAAKEQANKAISDTYSNIGALGQQWKDRVTDRYMARKANIASQRMNMMEGKARSGENLQGNGLNMLGNSAGSLLSMWGR
jgi:hypothetical protein